MERAMGIEQNTHRILNDFSRSSQFKNASYADHK